MRHELLLAVIFAGLIVALLILTGCGREADTPLTAAAGRGDTAEVRQLLKTGADVNMRNGSGYTPLMGAARGGHTEVMSILIGAGADMNTRDCAVNGWTPLFHALHKNQNGAARLLLDRGADPNARSGDCREKLAEGGSTPLMYAASYDNPEIVRALLEKGADPYAASNGSTALSRAVAGLIPLGDIDRPFAESCPTATVRALLEKAPLLKLKLDMWDRAALFFARRNNCSEVIALMEKQQNSKEVAGVR